jgi:dihydroneopterin aldolase
VGYNRTNMDIIFIEALEFYGYHGLFDSEQAVGHRYVVDVELSTDTSLAGRTDNLHDTIDYAAVAKRIVAIGIGEKYRLIESLAERIAAVLLDEFSVTAVKVRLKKISPPFNVIANAVGVDIERSKR